MSLPIESVLDPLVNALKYNRCVVLKAPPGAGKTTGVPPAILRHCVSPAFPKGQIWVIQPRRLAARSVASWLARTCGESVGETYGYHVRLDRKESKATRVLSMTTGMFLRRMQSDPMLEGVACVVFDEFHERTLDIDVAFALTTRLRQELRPELRLVIMSATLDPQPILDYLNCPSADADPAAPSDAVTEAIGSEWIGSEAIGLECEGRSYPVEVTYHPGNARDRLENRMLGGIQSAWQQTDGHVLAFLPGVGEIERAIRSIQGSPIASQAAVMPLHGSLSPKAQDAVLTHTDGQRKIIVATNIAETSVTVPGVTAVVDSGLAKTSVMDSRLGLSRLEITPISIASADQRAGRAGRTSAGACVRIWDQAANRSRLPYDAPEISRSDLSDVVLMLASLGETDLAAIGWLTPPPEHAIKAAQDLLQQLEALDANGSITDRGRAMAGLPLHPRIACFVIEAVTVANFSKREVAIAAALLSERDPFSTAGNQQSRLSLVEKIQRVQQDRGNANSRNPVSLGTIRSVAKQIERAIGDLPVSPVEGSDPSSRPDASPLERWAGALLAAYPDRVVLRRDDDPDRGRMVGGRGVMGLSAFDETATPSPLMLCIDVDGAGKESRVRSAVPIDPTQLNPHAVQEMVSVEFDVASESVRGRLVRSYVDLVLKQTPASAKDSEEASTCLYEAAKRCLADPELLGKITPPTRAGSEDSMAAIMERVRRVVAAENEGKPADVDDSLAADGISKDPLKDVLRQLCQGRLSFAELRKAPWKDYLIGQIGYDRWQDIQREAPTHLLLPSGNRAAVHYVTDKPPWIEAKIQECFGWQKTPRILMGRVAVQLHLLGPNRRPQQITEDLESFWANTYGEIRKELRRRYPKHYWPEDPTTAKATHNGLKPR
ncbi:ATP-dependent helicase HrpB [Neorhodopirellula lusitana]|uniref:ATP-dependent helicase HrpB n=1 Tax=Neorhodopirellula lusitana TaxID=445327 RepID=A0ABY1QGH4_9BACT|nr:ATP-dependent helicase C-terminal domain-containing protein [Neorhodopirellula lusitana]SMP69890.1 ATP-dependent helicase HrpB [Neorhodopirellula lusitana]